MSTLKTTNIQHGSAATPAITLAADGTAAATVSGINGGPLAGFRNAIINGNFDVWARGVGPMGNGYLADRWNAFLTTGSSFLQERAALTDAQRDVIGYDARYAWSGGIFDTASSVNLVQPIEGVETFAGQQVTVSFWAFVSSGTCTISGSLIQIFGTGGTPSSNVTANFTLSTTTVTTTPTKITGTVTLPSISGKVLGSDGNDRLTLVLSRAAGVANTLRIAQVQLEAGPVATPFERRPIGTELALCQRYYQTISGYMGGTVSGVATLANEIMHPVPMRSIPNVSPFWGINNNTTGATILQVSALSSRLSATSVGTGGYLTGASANLSAEL